jgi:hypothetical protein
MNVNLPEGLSSKTIAVAVVVLIAVSLFFLMPPAVNVNQNYSVSFGSAALEKNVLINGSRHLEEFEVRQGEGLALFVVVPKKLADNASKIAGISHNANLSIMEIDPILKFTHKEESPLQAKLEFDSANEDICTISLLLPESYLDSIDRSQLEELKTEFLGYGEMNPTCEEAKEIERELATELESVFAEGVELKGLKEEVGLVLQLGGPKHGLVLSALKGVKTRAKAKRQAATQPSVTQPPDTQEETPMVSIFFEDGPEKLKENYQGVLRENYPLLKNKGPINLTVSSEIPESYYSTYLVYPEPVFTGPKPVLDFEKPKVEIKGINPDYFKIKISGDEQPYLLELEFTRGTNELPLEPLSGEIIFDYKEIWPSSPIKIPINVWGNPCKASIEEKATNFEIYGELLECYETETRKTKMVYMANVQNKRKALDERVQEISKSPRVIFISPTRLSDVLKRFKEGVNYSQIASGIEAGRATEFQDELELAEHFCNPEVEKYSCLTTERDALKTAKTNYTPVLEAIRTEKFLCNHLTKEWVAMKDSDEIKQYTSVIGICQSLSAIAKDKFLADAKMLNDPFSETNRKAYVEKTIKLQEIVNQIEHANPCGLEKDCVAWGTKLEKDLFDNLNTHYGSNKELIKRLEGEVSDLQARIKYLEEIKPTWVGYLNPFVSLGAGLEAVGDVIFWEKEVSLSREEYKEQIEGEIADIKGQIAAIKGVIAELKSGNSLVGMYSEIREKYSGRGFKEERFIKSGSGDLIRTSRLLERWNAFYYNSTLRGELRKQSLLLGKDFLENIEEANLLYSTIHSLEMERDSVLAFEILLDAENYARVNGKKSWREANLVNTIKRVVEIEQGKVAKTDTIAFNLSQERKGIRKILEQVRNGIPLIDIFETNWGYGPNYTLDLGIPKVIDSDLTLLLREWDNETKEWAIEAFVEGFEVGISSVGTGDSVGFIGAPGLVVKAGNGNKNHVDVSLFVDNDYKKYFPKPNIEGLYSERVQGLVGGKKHSVYETVYNDVLLYVGLASEQISVPYPSSDKIDIVEVTVWLFEKSELSREDAENLITPGFTKIREIGETHRFQMFYRIGANGSRRLDAETIIGSHGIGADSHVKLYASKNNNIYASEKFPGLAFKFEWHPEIKGLTFYNHYSDIVKLAKSVKEEKPKVTDNDKVTEAKKDLLISKGLNNISIYTQIQVRKMLLEDKKVSDEKLASLLFMTAKRYERFSLWQEAISVYTQINDAFPSTAQGKLAIAQRDKVEEQVTAEKFVEFAEGLTSLESAVQYVLIAGVVKVIGRVVQLTKVVRVANVAKAQPAVQASEVLATSAKLLPGATSKFSKVKAFFNYPLEDLIARPIAKGINVYRGWKAARAFKSAQQMTAELKALGITWKPTATEISAAWSSPGTKIAEKGLTVWGSGDDLLYFHPGIGSVPISSNPQLLSKALPKLEKFAKSTAYLEKVKNVPEVIKALEKMGIRWTNSNTARYARIARDMVKDAATRGVSGTVPSPPETTALVIRDPKHAIEVMNQSLAPFALTETAKETTTIIPLIERIAGKTGVVADVLYKQSPLLKSVPVQAGLSQHSINPYASFVLDKTQFAGLKIALYNNQLVSTGSCGTGCLRIDVGKTLAHGGWKPYGLHNTIRHELSHNVLTNLSAAKQEDLVDAFAPLFDNPKFYEVMRSGWANGYFEVNEGGKSLSVLKQEAAKKWGYKHMEFVRLPTGELVNKMLVIDEAIALARGSYAGITLNPQTVPSLINFINGSDDLVPLLAKHGFFSLDDATNLISAKISNTPFPVGIEIEGNPLWYSPSNPALSYPDEAGKIYSVDGPLEALVPAGKNSDTITIGFRSVPESDVVLTRRLANNVTDITVNPSAGKLVRKITVNPSDIALKPIQVPTLNAPAIEVNFEGTGMKLIDFPFDDTPRVKISVPEGGLKKGVDARIRYSESGGVGSEKLLTIEVNDIKTMIEFWHL